GEELGQVGLAQGHHAECPSEGYGTQRPEQPGRSTEDDSLPSGSTAAELGNDLIQHALVGELGCGATGVKDKQQTAADQAGVLERFHAITPECCSVRASSWVAR